MPLDEKTFVCSEQTVHLDNCFFVFVDLRYLLYFNIQTRSYTVLALCPWEKAKTKTFVLFILPTKTHYDFRCFESAQFTNANVQTSLTLFVCLFVRLLHGVCHRLLTATAAAVALPHTRHMCHCNWKPAIHHHTHTQFFFFGKSHCRRSIFR